MLWQAAAQHQTGPPSQLVFTAKLGLGNVSETEQQLTPGKANSG